MNLRSGKVYATITHKRNKGKKEAIRPKFSLSAAISSLLITATLASAVMPTGISVSAASSLDTTHSTTVQSQQFNDINPTDWFYEDVQSVTAYGIISGVGNGAFNPQGILTVAAAIKLAATANAYYNDCLDELDAKTSEGHWVSKYLTYAMESGILNSRPSDSQFDLAISRKEMAVLFAKALPNSQYAPINDFAVAPEQVDSEEVKTLYRAGILIGDDSGFRLNDTITRAETAAIINRVVSPDQRVTVTEKKVASEPIDEGFDKTLLNVNSSDGKLHVYYDVDYVVHLNVGDLADVAVTATSSNGKSDTVYLTTDAYSDESRLFHLQFDIGGFKVGDKISFTFSDDTVTQNVPEATIISEEKYPVGDIGGFVGDFEPGYRLLGTSEYPLHFSLSKDYQNQAFVTIVDENGEPIGNREVTVCSYSGMMSKHYTTDSEGKITIDTEGLEGSAKLYFDNREFKFKTYESSVNDFDLYQLAPGKRYKAVVTDNPNYIAPN